MRHQLLLALALPLLAGSGCSSSQHGRTKANLASSGPIEASWSGGRDETHHRAVEFVVVRMNGRLATHAIEIYDDGREESALIGFIDPDRCVMLKQGRPSQLWPDGPGRTKMVNMGSLDDVPTDCSEYKETPASRLLP